MNKWYEVKVKYTKQSEDGRLKRVTEPYLIDSVSFTDAEARIYKELGEIIRGEFIVEAISKKDYNDIFHYEDSEIWNEATIKYTSIDADSGKQKVLTSKFMVTANTTKQAYERMVESLKDMMASFEITAVRSTAVVEVLPYIGEDKD